VSESLLVVIALLVVAGGPIIVIDTLIIRKLRRSGATPRTGASEEHSRE
jgi:hypothetical protein